MCRTSKSGAGSELSTEGCAPPSSFSPAAGHGRSVEHQVVKCWHSQKCIQLQGTSHAGNTADPAFKCSLQNSHAVVASTRCARCLRNFLASFTRCFSSSRFLSLSCARMHASEKQSATAEDSRVSQRLRDGRHRNVKRRGAADLFVFLVLVLGFLLAPVSLRVCRE